MTARVSEATYIWRCGLGMIGATGCRGDENQSEQWSYKSFLRCVHLRDGEVVVDKFGPVCLQLNGRPHHRVEVGEIMIQVDSFVGVTAQSPTCQL